MVFVIVCACSVCVSSLMQVVNSTRLEHSTLVYVIIRYHVQFHLGDHFANETTFGKSVKLSV